MNDDLQTPVVISILFEACHIINTIVDHKGTISAEDLAELKETMHLFAFDLMGLRAENSDNNQSSRRGLWQGSRYGVRPQIESQSRQRLGYKR